MKNKPKQNMAREKNQEKKSVGEGWAHQVNDITSFT